MLSGVGVKILFIAHYLYLILSKDGYSFILLAQIKLDELEQCFKHFPFYPYLSWIMIGIILVSLQEEIFAEKLFPFGKFFENK